MAAVRIRAHCRPFSTSIISHAGHPCYIGRTPVSYPPTVALTPSPTELQVSGPLGTTSVPLQPFMTLTFRTPTSPSSPSPTSPEGKQKELDEQPSVTVSVAEPHNRKQRSMWGLTRTLIANAVTGMTEGFTVPLHLVGVGYRAALEPDPRPAAIIARENGVAPGDLQGTPMRLNMKLGYSHSIFVPLPSYIKAEVPIPTRIMLSSNDKQKLGLFTAKVRNWRKPEPYKGKGIFVGQETVRMKSIKKK